MKRPAEPYVDEDEDLETAIRNSLAEPPVNNSCFDYPDTEYDEDHEMTTFRLDDLEEEEELRLAMLDSIAEESNHAELVQTIVKSADFTIEDVRKAALDELYKEMRQNSEKNLRAHTIKKNEDHNLDLTGHLLFIDVTLARILKYTTIRAIRSMCCVSKNLKKDVQKFARIYPLKSVLVETVEDFILALDYRRCLGSLYEKTQATKSYDTIRFRVPRTLPDDYEGNKRRYFMWPSYVKKFVISVQHNYQVNWLLRNFPIFDFFHKDAHRDASVPDKIAFYHHRDAFDDMRKGHQPLTYSYYDAEYVIPLPTKFDPFSFLFDGLPNFDALVEKETVS